MIAIKKSYGFLIFLLALTMIACKKEAALQPDNKEEFHLTVKDNPSDAVDHAIFQFYEATGIPVFYNDTVSRTQVDILNGTPRYSYQRLSIKYSPTGTQPGITWVLLPEKEALLPMLPLLKDRLVPQLANVFPLQSLFLVKSSRARQFEGLSARVNRPFLGFNTLMLINVNPATMSDSAQRKYVADALATIAYKMLRPGYDKRLVSDFNSITISTTSHPEVYGRDLYLLSPDGNGTLEDFSFLPQRFLPETPAGLSPKWEHDFLSYLEAVFFYNNNPSADFETDYAAYPLMIKKFKVIRTFLQEAGFKISG
ncbi:MAG: hypothetical protein ACTHMC_10195 [Pseudobacter sp.]|uniref:hypothetical protein n=1 Tax=Pseudobacter sp. TaxID=2045420 RepID=UPI003F7F2042